MALPFFDAYCRKDLGDTFKVYKHVEEILGTRVSARLHVLWRRVVAHYDADEFGHTALDLGQSVDPVSVLQANVEDAHVRPRCGDTFHRLVVRCCLTDNRMLAIRFDHLDEALAKRRRILHQEDFHASLDVSCLHGPQYAHRPAGAPSACAELTPRNGSSGCRNRLTRPRAPAGR